MKEQEILLVGIAGGILHVAATYVSSQCQKVVNFGRCVEMLTNSYNASGTVKASMLTQAPGFWSGFFGAPLGYAALSSIGNICNTLCESQTSATQKIKVIAFNSIAAGVTGYLSFHLFQ